MKFEDFIEKVEAAGWDWKKEEYEGKKGYFIRANNRQVYIKEKDKMQPACIHITTDAIENNDWNTIQKQLPDLNYVTRIVGYYSRINNWNVSKQGELTDRHKGEYEVACNTCKT